MPELSRRKVLRTAVIAVAAGAGSSWLPRAAVASTADQTVALTGATVIDATGRPARPDMTVLVRGQQIVEVARRDDVAIPAGATVHDLTGKYIIPGLCDMHVHSIESEEIAAPLYLANGITTVREMSGAPFLHQWRDRVESGTMLGPRSVIGSRIIDGTPSIGDPDRFILVGDETEAREAVRRAKHEGADFVKVYSMLPARLYRVIADEARLQRIPFAGHCPDEVPVPQASAARQRSIEHLYSTWYATSTREAELRRRIADLKIAQGDYLTWLHDLHELEWDAVHSYSRAKAERVFAELVRNHTRMVPTLTIYQVLDRPAELDLADDRLKYVPASVAAFWPMSIEYIEAGRSAEESAQWQELLDHRLAFVGALRDAGVPVLAGTDAGDLPYVFPGFALHDELANLVRAGFTPMQALQAATLEPARFLGLQNSLGTVERGKIADLVVLDADPLADIRNTIRIHAILVRGRVISAEQRNCMLAEVRRAVAEQTDPTQVAAPSANCCSGLVIQQGLPDRHS